MKNENLDRMMALAEDFFAAKNDPDQIAVDEEVMDRLRKIHPATLGEVADEHGPIAWMIVIPTTRQLMEHFLVKKITERELLDLTHGGTTFDAVYLCSALVLPEYRHKGLARRLALEAVRALQRDYPIRELFYWSFSREGTRLAESVSRSLDLPLSRRPE
jgi:ribosomal protein S18 acetylase RimI-like enzyme